MMSIPSLYHLPISCRSLLDRCGPLGAVSHRFNFLNLVTIIVIITHNFTLRYNEQTEVIYYSVSLEVKCDQARSVPQS